MLVRRYQGRNENEAIAKAKADLGPDAVILHIKQLSKNGIFDLKSAAKVEVIVALDQSLDPELSGSHHGEKSEFAHSSPPRLCRDFQSPVKSKADGFRAYAISSYSGFKETAEPKGLPSSESIVEESALLSAFSERSNQRRDKVGSDSPVHRGKEGRMVENWGLTARKLYQHLLSHEVQEEVAQKLSLSIQELISDESPLCLQEAANICIEELIRTSGGLNIAQRPAVIAFVGPTGVGKTTTIAKLAAHYHLQEKQKISLITVDTYRIAAVEQLKTYSTYIGVPLEVALTPQEMHQLVRKYNNCDLTLIDTPGRSQKDSMRIQELAMILSAAQPAEVHLLLNVTTQHRILWDIVRGFSVLSPNRLLFTKLDESVSFGNILNFSVALGKPVSYLTTGQDVPDDIEIATTEKITEYLLREEDVQLL